MLGTAVRSSLSVIFTSWLWTEVVGRSNMSSSVFVGIGCLSVIVVKSPIILSILSAISMQAFKSLYTMIFFVPFKSEHAMIILKRYISDLRIQSALPITLPYLGILSSKELNHFVRITPIHPLSYIANIPNVFEVRVSKMLWPNNIHFCFSDWWP